MRLAGCVGFRSRTSLRYACGWWPFRRADCIRLMKAAARFLGARAHVQRFNSQPDGFDLDHRSSSRSQAPRRTSTRMSPDEVAGQTALER